MDDEVSYNLELSEAFFSLVPFQKRLVFFEQSET